MRQKWVECKGVENDHHRVIAVQKSGLEVILEFLEIAENSEVSLIYRSYIFPAAHGILDIDSNDVDN